MTAPAASPAAGAQVAEALAAAERALVDGLALEPLMLPGDLAGAVGEWKGAPVTIETRAWRGGAIRYARCALVRGGGLTIANVLALPDPDHPLPLLGADVVALGLRDGRTMVAADLSPSTPERVGMAALAERRAGHPALPPGGELPAWCAEWFSPHALYTRVADDQLPDALAALADMVALFVELAARSRAVPSSATVAADMQYRYGFAHRTDDKGLTMLGRMFGDRWAERYVARVLFPDD